MMVDLLLRIGGTSLGLSALIPSQWRMKLGINAPGQALPADASTLGLDREEGGEALNGAGQSETTASAEFETASAGNASVPSDLGPGRAARGFNPWRLDFALALIYAGGVVGVGVYFLFLYQGIWRKIGRLARMEDPGLNAIIAAESALIGLRRDPAGLLEEWSPRRPGCAGRNGTRARMVRYGFHGYRREKRRRHGGRPIVFQGAFRSIRDGSILDQWAAGRLRGKSERDECRDWSVSQNVKRGRAGLD